MLAASGMPEIDGGTKITAATTYYDRKEGYAYFSGGVCVTEGAYRLHSDSAYVFMDGTNALKRVIAVGHVALTNGTQRAYGAKATYYREPGMLVLTGGDGTVAEVRDETPDGAQTVRGKKIKYWTNTRQVEVVEADISAPAKGSSGGFGLGLFGR